MMDDHFNRIMLTCISPQHNVVMTDIHL